MLSRALLASTCLLLACGDAGGSTETTTSSTSSTDADTSGTTGAATATGTPTTGDTTTGDTTTGDTTTGDATTGDATTGDATAGDATTGDATTGDTTTGAVEDLDMQPEDFACILGWDKIRKFRVTNLLGHLDETLAVANDPNGGVYPVGTVVQLIPNEAMVKRAPGFAPDNSDWEFFALDTSARGTTIVSRGSKEVVNGFGGNCFDCHAKAAPQWDRLCEQGHGCDPLPFTAEQIEMVQQSDPRCP